MLLHVKKMSFYRLNLRLRSYFPATFLWSHERLQNLCPGPGLKLHTAEPVHLSGPWDVCTINTFIVISSGHINDYHPSSYLCLKRSVCRCGGPRSQRSWLKQIEGHSLVSDMI